MRVGSVACNRILRSLITSQSEFTERFPNAADKRSPAERHILSQIYRASRFEQMFTSASLTAFYGPTIDTGTWEQARTIVKMKLLAAPALGLELLEQPRQARDDVRFLEPEVVFFFRIIVQVIQLSFRFTGLRMDVFWFAKTM